MMPTFASHLDALGQWRVDTDACLTKLARFAREHDLLDDSTTAWFDGMRQRLASEKLMVAFVAEFSRGKSELINAIFFSDKGQRIMPATAGRTTMCPVELAYDPQLPDGLSLLPIETRLSPIAMTEWREKPSAWTQIPVDMSQSDDLVDALSQVVRTRHVPVDEAEALGFWHAEHPDDNPPVNDEGLVEVPLWRHARINLPHPLLRQGLVVLDTPGLNAVGAEPELTLGMLPQAHATVFVLGADTGVTRSDLDIWRNHLSGANLSRYVVLNKIDTLADPLSTPQQVQDSIARQCVSVAHTLDLAPDQVFPVSARQALTARLQGDPQGLIDSRLMQFETALSRDLLPKRRRLLADDAVMGAHAFQAQIERHLGELHRQIADQSFELRGLRGKSSGKVLLMLQRLKAEAAEFEQCAELLTAMRSVHARMLKSQLQALSNNSLMDIIDDFKQTLGASWLPIGARKSFGEMCERLRTRLQEVQTESNEIYAMLQASYTRLNTAFGFALALAPAVNVVKRIEDLDLLEKNYVHYFGLTQAIRLAQSSFQEQFRRMLGSRLRVVFDAASHDIETWNKTASAQVNGQLRERRRNFKRRYETLERIQSASTELNTKLEDLNGQEAHVQHLQTQLDSLVADLVQQAESEPIQAVPAEVSSEHISFDA